MPLNHRHGALSTRAPEPRSLTASPELLALMARKPLPANDLLSGYMSGEIVTAPARQVRNQAAQPFQGRFTKARYQRSPDREKSIHRRRTLAATWPAPPSMCGHLTPSQTAYARIIADEFAQHGFCDRTLDEIAARGGMCKKTAKRAQARLKQLGWISVEVRGVTGKKNLSNVVRVISAEWLSWIEMGPRRRRPIGGHSCPSTENHSYPYSENRNSLPVVRSQEAWRGEKSARSGPNMEGRACAQVT